MIKKFEDFIKGFSLKTESKHTDDDKKSKVKVGGEHKHLAGVKEVIEIVGLGKMKVKLDSGNSSLCALIVQDFKEDKENKKVKFNFDGREREYDVVKHVRIWHHGTATIRPVIKLDLIFNDQEYKDELVDLKISDLTGTRDYRSRMLLSKAFMAKANIVIDPSKEFNITNKKEIKKKKTKKNK
jgi:hypothetical protein